MSKLPVIPKLPIPPPNFVELTEEEKRTRIAKSKLRSLERDEMARGDLYDKNDPLAQLVHVTGQEMAKRKNGTPHGTSKLAGYQRKTSKKSRKRHNSRKKPRKHRTRRMRRH